VRLVEELDVRLRLSARAGIRLHSRKGSKARPNSQDEMTKDGLRRLDYIGKGRRVEGPSYKEESPEDVDRV